MLRYITLAGLLALPLLLVGCGGDAKVTGGKEGEKGTASSTAETPKSTAGKKRLIFLTNGNSPFWDACRSGLVEGGKDFKLDDAGLTVAMEVNDGTAQGQIEKLRQYASQSDVAGVAVSVIQADNPAIMEEMKNLQDKGIKIITVDGDVNRDKFRDARPYYLGTDNIVGGRVLGTAGQAILKARKVEMGGYVQFAGFTDNDNARNRMNGFKEAVGEAYEEKDRMPDGMDLAKARDNVRNAITNHKDLVALVGIWSYNAPAIAEVVTERNVRDKITVVTFDAEAGAIEQMTAGKIDAMVVQNPFDMGYQTVKLLKAMIEKDDKVLKEMFPNQGQKDGDIYTTGLRVVVPEKDTPLTKEMFDAKSVEYMTLPQFKEWLKKVQLEQLMTPAALGIAAYVLLQLVARVALALVMLRLAGIIQPFKEMQRSRLGLAVLLLIPVTLGVHWAVALLDLPAAAGGALQLDRATEIAGNVLISLSWIVIYVTVQTAATLFVFQICGLAQARPKYSELALLGAIVLVGLLTTVIDSGHSYYTNPAASLREIARNSALLGIFALGATVVIISGGIDLSAGSTIAFSGTVCAAIMLSLAPKEVAALKPVGLPVVFAAIVGTVAMGFLVGTLHAWLITSIRLPPFIATLATLVGLRSFARALCEYTTATLGSGKSSQIYFNDPFFKLLRDHVCIAVAAFCVLAIITWIILNFTILGRHIYALGGNENAARLSGIRTDNVKWFAYCFAAFTAAIAAVFYVANVSVAAPVDQARGHELNAIAAAVVGGCSLQGGVGTVSGTILGAIFLRVVIDAVAKVIKTGADVYEGMIVGVVVVIAVTFSQIQQVIASGRKLLPGALGICAIPVLALLSGMMALMTLGKWAGLATGLAAIILLSVLKVYESSQSTAKV